MNKGKSLLVGAALLMVVALCAGCAPQTAGSASGDGGASEPLASTGAWSMDADCLTCHGDQGASLDDGTSPASKHGAQGLTCVQCHTDQEGLTRAHEDADTGKMPTALKLTKVDTSACFSCHGSYEELAQATADGATLEDTKGKAVNPHEVPTLGEGHEKMDCSSCHAMHGGADKDVAAIQEYCYSCHHSEVFECHTCHE